MLVFPIETERWSIGTVEDALIQRFGSLVDEQEQPKIRTDDGSIFLAKYYRDSLKRLGIGPEFTPYHCPSANGIIERWNNTFKEECAWCHVLKTIAEAEKIITKRIDDYNRERMHSRLGYSSPNHPHFTILKIKTPSEGCS